MDEKQHMVTMARQTHPIKKNTPHDAAKNAANEKKLGKRMGKYEITYQKPKTKKDKREEKEITNAKTRKPRQQKKQQLQTMTTNNHA